jgi:hypothetical protein
MFTTLYLCNVLLISQIGHSNISVPVDCTGRPDMSSLQRANGGGRSNLSPSRARHTELASQRSTFTPKTITANKSYASIQCLLPPTSNYNFLYSTMQFAGPWQVSNIAAQPLWRPLPIPPTVQISIGAPGQGTIGITPTRIGSGVIGSVVEKPFANFNSATVNGLGGVHYSANTFGNKWTWERDTYQLIDLSSGRVLREWDGGTSINLRYGGNGHLRLGGQNFFINQGGSFQNAGH